MNIVSSIYGKLIAFFLGITATFRKLLCFLHVVRRRKNSGSILPLVANHSSGLAQGEIQTSLPSNDFELQSWDSWDTGTNFGQTSHPSSATDALSVGNHGNHIDRTRTLSEVESEPEVDFFQDMQPQIKRTAKILVRKKVEDNGQVPSGLSSRLAMSAETGPVSQTGELGHWEESENAWSSEAMEDLSWEADSALKEKKHLDRLARTAEQQRKKLERERERNMKTDKRLTAVKLS